MPDVYLCAHCGSTNLMAQMNSWQCLECGNRTLMDGTACPVEPVFEAENPHERRPV